MFDAEPTSAKNIGIELSAASIITAAVDSAGTVTDTFSTSVDPQSDPFSALIDSVKELENVFGAVGSLGIAIPGLVSSDKMQVAHSTHFPEHSSIDIKSEITSATGRTPLIENDANAAAYGEFKRGAGRGGKNLFYITLGRGIGGALIIDGSIWRGASGYAGEFGYLTINSEGVRIEDMASAENVVRRTRNRFNRDSTSSLSGLDEEAIDLDQIVEAADSGDDFARLMLERTGTYVGMGVASVINLMNIETVVVGGEIMRAGRIVLPAITRRARELSFGPSFAGTTIIGGQLGQNAAAIGAAFLAGGL